MGQNDKSASNTFPWKEILGFLGVMFAAYIGYLGIRSQTEIPIQATQTAEARLAETANSSTMTQLAILPSVIWTPSPTATETPTFTFTPATADVALNVLLQDDFIDTRNGWLLLDEQFIKSKIIGGKYKHTITCPQEYESFYCGHYFLVPHLLAKNLQFELDATIKDISPSDAEVMIAFQLRRNASNYYDIYFRSLGQYTVNLVHNGSLDKLLGHTPIPSFSPNIDTVNRYGFSAIDTLITPLFNGQELLSVEDGNINQAGSVYIAIFVSRGSSAVVELDNLIATEKSTE